MEDWAAALASHSEVTLEGWIFMIGLRVFDVGALIVWLVWFFRLRDDDDGPDDGGGGAGNAPEPEEPKGPTGGLRHPAARLAAVAVPPPRPSRGPAPSPGPPAAGSASGPGPGARQKTIKPLDNL